MEQSSPYQSNDQLHISSQAKDFLKEASKWATFIAIMGYIGIGFMVLAAIFMGFAGSFMEEEMPGVSIAVIIVLYLVMAILYYFPITYLYKFANNMRNALDTNNNTLLTNAFEFQKSHYKFMGILIIVMLAIYALIFVGAFIMGIFGFMK